MKVTKEKDSKWWHLESGIPVTKTGTQTDTSTLFQATEIDTLSFAPSRMHTLGYAIEGTDGISYQQSFHAAVLLNRPVAVCSVWYLFHHHVVGIRKHISHSKWHRERFKTKAGSDCRIIMWTMQQATDKDEALAKDRRSIYFQLYCRCARHINIYWLQCKSTEKQKCKLRTIASYTCRNIYTDVCILYIVMYNH